MYRRILAVAITLLAAAAPAHAQFDETLWGVSGTINPRWVSPVYAGLVFGASENTAEHFSLEGSDLAIGFVRGRPLGGEWGVSLVRISFKDGSFVRRDSGDVYTTTDNSVLGAEIHRFYVFGTIARRVQIGMNLGVGAGQLRGQMQVRTSLDEAATAEAKEFLQVADTNIPVFPLFKLEFAVAAIIAPGLKARVNAGVNFPGYQKFSITGTYLFGAR